MMAKWQNERQGGELLSKQEQNGGSSVVGARAEKEGPIGAMEPRLTTGEVCHLNVLGKVTCVKEKGTCRFLFFFFFLF
jgi:hypothetical protein